MWGGLHSNVGRSLPKDMGKSPMKQVSFVAALGTNLEPPSGDDVYALGWGVLTPKAS